MFVSIVVTALLFFGLDMLWIQFVAVGMYKKHLPDFLLRSPQGNVQANLIAAALFYVVAISCLYLLAIKPATTIKQAVTVGAISGLFAYGTYALTAQSIFKNWKWSMTVFDILWGVILCSVCALVGFLLKK